MVGGKGAGGKAKQGASIDSVVSQAVGAIHALADKHVAPGPKRTVPVAPRTAPPKRRPPATPASHDLIVHPAKPVSSAGRSIEQAAGTPQEALNVAKGIARRATARQRAVAAQSQHPAQALPGLRTLDDLLGGPVQGAIRRAEHPLYDVNQPGHRDAAGNPMLTPDISAGVIPWGIVRGLRGIGKAKAVEEAAGADWATRPLPEHTPSAAAHAQEHGIDLANVKGTGRGGKILKGDVESARLQGMTAKERVQTGLKGARSARGKQNVVMSEERSRRASEVASIMADRSLTVEQAHAKALDALRGELPKIHFGGLERDVTPDLVSEMKGMVRDSNLLPYDTVTTLGALNKAFRGEVPQPRELRLLEHVFGKDTARSFQTNRAGWSKVGQYGLEVINVPRAFMATADLSAPFRQGLVAGARHPVIFAKNFGPMIRSAGSEKTYQALQDSIHTDPNYNLALAAGVDLTDVENFASREEQFAGAGMAEKITGGKHSPVRMSGRAYTGFLDKMRMDVFNHHIRAAEALGYNVHDEKFLKGLGRFINTSTGRGHIPGKAAGLAPYLNHLMFSPRLFASRVNMLNPVYYYKLHPYARKQALISALNLAGLTTSTLGLAALAGAKVVRDPRNSDFAKVRLGNTRFDVLGGFQQPIRLASQLATDKAISSTTGDPLTLGPGIGHVSRPEITWRFFRGKLAPTPSMIYDAFSGTDYAGKPFSWKREAYQHFLPLLAQDAADLYHQPVHGMNGIEAALAGYGIGAFGIGVQTYGPNATNPAGKYEKKIKDLGITESPQMRTAIDLANKRAQARAKYPKNAHGRLYGDIDLLAELGKISPAEAAAAKKTAASLSDYALSKPLKGSGGVSRASMFNKEFDPTGVLSRIDTQAAIKKAKASHG